MKHLIFPGSFDPIHNGHVDVVRRALALCDRLTVAVLHNAQKSAKLFAIEERLAIIRAVFAEEPKVAVEAFEGLLVNYVQHKGATAIIKGLRGPGDFEYELQMAHMNRAMAPAVDTLFVITDPRWSFVSSTRVREVASFGADVSALAPQAACEALRRKLSAG
jgi:pantetheine-phosphate adenylyltransferase